MTTHMNTSIAEALLDDMQNCLSLAEDVKKHEAAKARYSELRDRLSERDADLVAVMDVMWKAVLSGRRSAFFWEGMCDAEQQLTERIAESHAQLRQNHLRLIQEQ
ncbi:MAG: hypothetical protein AAFU78_01460 [Cyanobacteria bacterium J06633_2]